MTAQEAYEKLYKGVKSQIDKWADDELQHVYKLGQADPQPTARSREVLEAIKTEMDHRGKGELVK